MCDPCFVRLSTPQGDALVTKCTYNTEDRNKATVVSLTQSNTVQPLKYILLW